jgi:hypothetical protein
VADNSLSGGFIESFNGRFRDEYEQCLGTGNLGGKGCASTIQLKNHAYIKEGKSKVFGNYLRNTTIAIE